MAKHKSTEKKKALHDSKKRQDEEIQFPETVEKTFKRILRILSWTVGTAFVLIVLLPEFNSPTLDKITRVIYLIGITSLLVFVIIEFFAASVKKIISRIVHV